MIQYLLGNYRFTNTMIRLVIPTRLKFTEPPGPEALKRQYTKPPPESPTRVQVRYTEAEELHVLYVLYITIYRYIDLSLIHI